MPTRKVLPISSVTSRITRQKRARQSRSPPHDVSGAELRSSRGRWKRSGDLSYQSERLHRGPEEAASRFLVLVVACASSACLHRQDADATNIPMEKFDVIIIGSGPGGY